MVARCTVKVCKNVHSEKKVGLFKIPKVIHYQGEQTAALSKERRLKWLKVLRHTEESAKEHTRICGKHFYSGRPSALYDQTNPDWIPSLVMDIELPKAAATAKVAKISANMKRYERRLNRSKHQPQPQMVKKNVSSSSAQSSNCYTLQLPTNTLGEVTTVIKIEAEEHDDISLTESNEESTEVITACDFESVICTGNVFSEACFEEPERTVFKIEPAPTYDSLNLINGMPDTSVMTFDKMSQVDFPNNPVQRAVNTGTQTDQAIPFHKITQASLRFNTDAGVQTLFRVCELFELESAMMKLKDAQITIENLNKSLVDAHECVDQYKAKVESMNPVVEMLRKELQKRAYSESYFIDDHEKVKFFTGFVHFGVLENVHNEVKHLLLAQSKLSTFQQCVLTFMKLKQSLMNRDLAYRFNISERTVGRIFYNCLDVLYK